MKDLFLYLSPTAFIDSDYPVVQALAKDLTMTAVSDEEKITRIFYYVRDSVHYNMYTTSSEEGGYKASKIIEKGKGFCAQKAIVLTALARAAKIPSRLVLVAIRNHKAPPEVVEIMKTDVFFPHIYNQFYINSQWISAAATFDKIICDKINVAAVEFDGLTDALLPAQDLSGNPYIDYVDHYGKFADFPYQLIMENMPKYYGPSYTKWFFM